VDTRPSSIATVDGRFGRLNRVVTSPVRAASRYASQSSATVIASRSARFSRCGSRPSAAARMISSARARLIDGVGPIGSDFDPADHATDAHLSDKHLPAGGGDSGAEVRQTAAPHEIFLRPKLHRIEQALGKDGHSGAPYDEFPESHRNQADGNKGQHTATYGNVIWDD
jgi:hypothetical protein